jgi:hypothetical protein
MEKKMVQILPIPLTHIAPINHNDMLLPKNVHGKDLPCGCQPKKESHPQKNLSPPNTLPREKTDIVTNQDTVEGFNNKQPFSEGAHQGLSLPSHLSQLTSYQNLIQIKTQKELFKTLSKHIQMR